MCVYVVFLDFKRLGLYIEFSNWSFGPPKMPKLGGSAKKFSGANVPPNLGKSGYAPALK